MITLPRRLLDNIRRHWQLYLMALPGFAIILLLVMCPCMGYKSHFGSMRSLQVFPAGSGLAGNISKSFFTPISFLR